MNTPLLTVLMPVYNAEKYLREAVESILTQTFAAFEFLIIDDCSTDGSAAIIESYGDVRIRFLRNETNRGISETLNRGIELATTEFIARMDADDISYPERLAQQYAYMTAHPDCALLSCAARVVDEARRPIRIDRFHSEYFYYNLTFICWMYHPTVVYRRCAVQHVGGYRLRYAEDHALFLELARHYKIWNLEQVLLDYRVTSESLHQVRFPAEYEQAQREVVRARLRDFMGPDFTLSDIHLECLRHRFEPILRERNIDSMAYCLRLLDRINEKIINTENCNNSAEFTTEAARHKKRFILQNLTENLTTLEAIILMWKVGIPPWEILAYGKESLKEIILSKRESTYQ
ncbi:glycosyltransferase family 2 protein [Tellurirhabdus rosea]|uniref:glycosyltransferase family 2 protein n=1 Tax=Tellurirhabdus rosea TaxID=2674997 RepID=UPI002255E6F8|nr:glycosyltransferase [Tellurirhabdus rosea]